MCARCDGQGECELAGRLGIRMNEIVEIELFIPHLERHLEADDL